MDDKIAIEEHFITPDFVSGLPQYVNPQAMAEIQTGLLDLTEKRLPD